MNADSYLSSLNFLFKCDISDPPQQSGLEKSNTYTGLVDKEMNFLSQGIYMTETHLLHLSQSSISALQKSSFSDSLHSSARKAQYFSLHFLTLNFDNLLSKHSIPMNVRLPVQ